MRPALGSAGVLAIVVVLAGGCTGAAQPATARTGLPSAAPATEFPQPWSTAQPPADCPVTRSTPDVRPSPPINPEGAQPVPYVRDWYGNDALWVKLPPTGVLPADSDPQGLQTKFPWWRSRPGRLTVHARRLDGPAGGFTAYVPDGYGDLGFQVSGLSWGAAGCWRVSGTVHGKSLAFTVWVHHFPDRH